MNRLTLRKWGFITLFFFCIGAMIFAGGGRQNVPADELGNFPSRPIRLIVPFGPGGGTDVFVRTVLRYVDPSINIGVVNIAGAAGLVGAMEAFHASNDGYTILAHMPVDLIVFSLTGQSDIPLWSEFEPICWAVADHNGFFTNRNSGFNTAAEMVAFARANPGSLTFGTVGTRTINALNSRRTLNDLGILDLVTMVPYDGGAQIATALLGNHVQAASGAVGDVRHLFESGDVIPLGIVGEQRTVLLPNVPSTRELNIMATTPNPRGFFAPRGTPRARIEFLANAFRTALENPATVAALNAQFIDANFVDGETARRRTQDIYNDLRQAFGRYLD